MIRNNILYIGIFMLVFGILFLVYSIDEIKEKKAESDSFGSAVLLEGFIASIVLILVGLIFIFKNV